MAVEIVKVQIEADSKGAEKNIDSFTRKVKTSVGEFENLNEAIGKTQDALGTMKIGSKEFKEASKELQTLKDRLKDTENNSLRFTEALGKQPGVIGLVGQSLEGLRGTMKVFMANPIIAVIAGISAAFLALKESLTRTEEGSAKLTKITEGLEKIMNGLFAVIEPIAMQLADMVAGLLENEKVMKTLSTVAGVLGAAFGLVFNNISAVGTYIVDVLIGNFKALVAVAKGAGDVLKGVFTFDWDLIKAGSKKVFDGYKDGVTNVINATKTLATTVVDGVVTAFEDGVDAFGEGSKRLTKAGREEKKKLDEQAKKDKEAREAQAKTDRENASKIQLEAELSLLDERQRALLEREMRFNEEKAALIKAGYTDFTALAEEYRLDVNGINQTYDEKDANALKVFTDQQNALKKLKRDEDNKNLLAYVQFQIDAKQFQADAEEVITEMQINNIQDVGNVLGMVAGKNKKLAIAALLIEKGGAIAQVVVSTARAIASATAAAAPFLANPVTAGPTSLLLKKIILQSKIGAGIAIAGITAGAAQGISSINQAQVPGDEGGSASGGGGGAPSFASPQGIEAPQIQSNVGQTPGSQIAQTISRTQDQPVRAYVVSTDVSSNQALDRRTNGAATFGG